jgi:ubiquinone/menaquinone biosynthesis C-methylase UbiE
LFLSWNTYTNNQKLMTTDNSIAIQIKAQAFESLYVAIREQEGRLYTDEELALLPDTAPAHRHAKEWQVRKRSCMELVRYLSKKETPLRILEIGCGNGWLAHQLSKMPGSGVTGLDVNRVELEQARRVFGASANLRFLLADPFSEVLDAKPFDVIVLAAAVQYFSSLKDLLNRCLQLLNSRGEVHLLDTHFYSSREAMLAKQRSARYFASVGYPAMQDYYYHHLLADIKSYPHTTLYDPRSLVNKLFDIPHPFFWICIHNNPS